MGVKLNPPILLTPDLDLSQFSCGKPALDEWIKKYALQAGSSGTANTFILHNERTAVVGYYSISMGSISQEVAFRAIIMHPIDNEAADFYMKFGFEQSPISNGQLMILMKDVRKALGVTSSAN